MLAALYSASVQGGCRPPAIQQRASILLISSPPSSSEGSQNAAEKMHAEAVKNSEKLYHRSGTSSGLAAPFDDWDCYSFPGAGSSVTLGADATAPGGFAEDELARVSRSALLSPKDCASIIREAEAVGAWQESGRVAHYARQAGCLTPLSALPQSVSTLSPFLATTLFPAIREAFPCGCGSASLRVSDARLVKYNASASQTQLGMHRDGPLVTATIALNGLDEYAGGGTLIEALAARDEDSAAGSAADSVADSVAEPTGHVRVPTGHVVLHPGAVRHGGNPITSGLRCAAAASFQPFSSAVWSGSCRALEAPTAQGCLPWMLPAARPVPAARPPCLPPSRRRRSGLLHLRRGSVRLRSLLRAQGEWHTRKGAAHQVGIRLNISLRRPTRRSGDF